MKIFILGAADPEMEEIEAVLKATKQEYRFATILGRRVQAETAYSANSVSAPIPKDASIIFIECHIFGLIPELILDHHREGDAGFGKLPQDYMEGSSLGQLLTLLNLPPTLEQRIIAAADHCPTQAYRGECPFVHPADLMHWRTLTRAVRRGVSYGEMNAAILRGKAVLENAEKVLVGNELVAFVPHRDDEVTEASARFNLPFMYKGTSQTGTAKFGIMSAKPDTIDFWMSQCGLSRVYGTPVRGYAGGYV